MSQQNQHQQNNDYESLSSTTLTYTTTSTSTTTTTIPSASIVTSNENDRLNLHYIKSMKHLNDMYSNKKLCDVVLICNNERIYAHRVILSANSDYFYAMFTNNLIESQQTEIVINDIDSEALKSLVNYIYTGKIELSDFNVCSILSAATMLQLDYVVQYGCDYLLKCLHSSNCIGIYRFSDKYSLKHLNKISKQYILDNYEKVTYQQEFYDLTANELKLFLSSDDLNVNSEEFVFESLMKWLNYDNIDNRIESIDFLLECVRLPLLSPLYLTKQIENNKLLQANKNSQSLLLEAATYHIIPEKFYTTPNIRTNPRKSTVGYLISIGGMVAQDCLKSQTIEKYDYRTDKWTIIGNMNGKRLQCGVALHGGRLYIVGGREGLKTLNTVESYDLVKETWSNVNSMSTHRHGLAATTFQNLLYAVGGHDGWSFLNTVERFDFETGMWTYVASMLNARSTHGVAVLHDRIYVVGGRDSGSCLKSVEYFNSNSNKWIQCTPMYKQRGGVGVASFNGFLYAVGGHELPNNLMACNRFDCAERYDPKNDQWTIISNMCKAKEAVGISGLGSYIFVAGGFDGQRYLCDVEKYDPLKNEWTKVQSLNVAKAGTSLIHVKNNVTTHASIIISSSNDENNLLNQSLASISVSTSSSTNSLNIPLSPTGSNKISNKSSSCETESYHTL